MSTPQVEPIKSVNIENPQYYGAHKKLNEALNYFEQVSTKLQGQFALLDEREKALANIDVEYNNKLQAAKDKLQYDLTVYRDETFAELASTLGMAVVSTIEWNAMNSANEKVRREYAEKEANLEKEIGKAVGMAEAKVRRDNEMANLEQANEVTTLKAERDSLKSTVEFLKEQLTAQRESYERMLENASRPVTITQKG